MHEDDRKKVKGQVGRMGQMQGFPRHFEALTELIDTFMEAPSLQTVADVVTHFLADATPETRCPMPAQVRSEISRRQMDFHPDPKCPICKGTGATIVEHKGYSYAGTCSCIARRPAPRYPQPGDKSAADLKAEADRVAEKRREIIDEDS